MCDIMRSVVLRTKADADRTEQIRDLRKTGAGHGLPPGSKIFANEHTYCGLYGS